MKRFLAVMLLLGTSLAALADGKIAVVNFEQAILNTDAAQQKIHELEEDADYKANMNEAKKIQEEGTKLTEQYKKEGPTMSPQQQQELEGKIKEKQADLEHVGHKIQDAKKKLLGELMMGMKLQAMKAAQDIIDAEGIGLLLNASPQAQTVYHADTSFDITAKVTDKLNKQK